MDEKASEYFIDFHAFPGTGQEKVYKATLAQSENILVGLNRLEPGQSQPVHIHIGEDKFYFVLEGSGYFQVGDVFQTAGPGMLVWAPATLSHSVTNNGADELVVLVVIAPAPGH